jgi:biopolymer transport protein ExbD
MSLERFEMKRNIFHPLLAVGFINFVLLVVIIIMSTTIFAKPSGVQMEFPPFKGGGSASPPMAGTHGVVITVTGENVIYIDGRVVTLIELRRFLAQGNFRREALMIRADAKASMGRVADILDLCRGIAGASVNVSTIL